jgi:hypothetical protein
MNNGDMGLMEYSLKWVESDPDENGYGGGGGAAWVDVSEY